MAQFVACGAAGLSVDSDNFNPLMHFTDVTIFSMKKPHMNETKNAHLLNYAYFLPEGRARCSVVIETLYYKPEGRGLETQ
jgi:hypothetical protein